MPTSTNVTNLKINELTEAQYDAAVLNGTISANELSVLTDAQIDQLPLQTGNAGKFLTTDGTDASWSDKPLVNETNSANAIMVSLHDNQSYSSSTTIGVWATNGGQYGTAIGASSAAGEKGVALGATANSKGGTSSIAIGYGASTLWTNNAILLNASGTSVTNSDANTFKVANTNGNFEMMDANGNLPADRLAPTTGLADGNYRLRLTMANGVPTLTWVAE
jgi:hypothetical protein